MCVCRAEFTIVIQVEVSWDLTPCSDVVGYQRFGGPCCFHLYHAVSQPRRPRLESLSPWKPQISPNNNLEEALGIGYVACFICFHV